jgi:predicted dienelactone hydrolase
MKKRHIALAGLGIIAATVGTVAYVASPTVHEGNSGESPELGRMGEYRVGTELLQVRLAGRVTFSKLGIATGGTETETRALDVRIYYPAIVQQASDPITYRHTMRPPGMEPLNLEFDGRAFDGATPLPDGQFPLVVMSHGFNGWSTQFSNLAEHIASRGYVVASIDHADRPIESITDFVHSFAYVLASRSLDQRQVIAQLLERADEDSEGPYALIDPEQIALIGYSMGGYGALATGGGDYDYQSDTFGSVPADALEPVRTAAAEPSPVDAIIAFAPWGGQPDNRVWSAETLAPISIPVLLISGSQDDVSNHAEGVSWIFDQLTGTQRHMLVFREARHNIIGNAFELPADAPFRAIEFLAEPVWRQDRINSINQHFVTAFLDLTLKGDTDKASYLDVPVPTASDSQWPVSTGEQLNGKFAGEAEPDHWRGFQRRWAAGLELRAKAAGE